MKYRVYVKEIWVQPYIVEANSKAHAKHLVESLCNNPHPNIRKESVSPQRWGFIASDKWDVEET